MATLKTDGAGTCPQGNTRRLRALSSRVPKQGRSHFPCGFPPMPEPTDLIRWSLDARMEFAAKKYGTYCIRIQGAGSSTYTLRVRRGSSARTPTCQKLPAALR